LKQSLSPLQVAELKGNKRKFKEDFGRKRKKDEKVVFSPNHKLLGLEQLKQQRLHC
jgi:hypothetical protein